MGCDYHGLYCLTVSEALYLLCCSGWGTRSVLRRAGFAFFGIFNVSPLMHSDVMTAVCMPSSTRAFYSSPPCVMLCSCPSLSSRLMGSGCSCLIALLLCCIQGTELNPEFFSDIESAVSQERGAVLLCNMGGRMEVTETNPAGMQSRQRPSLHPHLWQHISWCLGLACHKRAGSLDGC